MKIFLTLTLMLSSLLSLAQTYYVSPGGDNANPGLSQEQAWKSISHVNAEMDNLAGATVLFERGQTFIGQLNITADGLTVGAYGGGNKPIIRATRWLADGWVSAGNNLWEVSLPTTPERVRALYRARTSLPLGRFPNVSDPEHEGFFYHEETIKEGLFPKTIVDNQLSELVTQDWTGAEIMIRMNRWRLVTDTVASINGNQISIVNPPRLFEPKNSGGYFFQNDIKTLDQEGEWSHDGEQNKLYLYSTTDPNGQQLSYTAYDYAVQIEQANGVSLENLSLFGSNEAAVGIEGSNNATVSRLTIAPTGFFGVYVNNSSGASILDCEIRNTNLEAIRVERNSEGTTIKDCVLEDIALVPGRGQADGDGYSGIWVLGSGGTVEHNVIRRTGYCGIRSDMTSGLIKRNFIERVCSIKDDGGGIYIQDMLEGTQGEMIVEENIIQRVVGNGASRGSDNVDKQENAEGIYLDTKSEGVTVRYNTTSDASFGLYVHDSDGHDMYENTTFDNVRFGMRLAQSSNTGLALSDLEVDRNIIIDRNTDSDFGNSLPVKLEMNRDPEPGDNKDALKPIGKLRYNYLINALATRANRDVSLTFKHDGSVYPVNRCCSQAGIDLSANELNALYDTTFFNTQSVPVAADNPRAQDFLLPIVNPSDAPLTQSLPGGVVYTDARGQLYQGEVTVAPWRSVVLFESELPTGTPNTPLELNVTEVNLWPTLSWTDASSDEEFFVIERSQGDFESFAVLDTVAANTESYVDADRLGLELRYFYRIQAVNQAGASYYSNQTNLILAQSGPTPVPTTTDVIDPISEDWTVPLSFSDGWNFQSGTPEKFDGDTERRNRLSSEVETVTYRVEDLSDFELVAYTVFRTNAEDFIRFFASSDNETFTPVAVSRERSSFNAGWTGFKISPTEALPAGTTYLKVEVGDGEEVGWSPQLGEMTLRAGEPTIEGLRLTSVCSDDPAVERRWRVTNPNEVPVQANWQIYGTSITGSVAAVPGQSFFTTPTQEGSNTLKLFWQNEEGQVRQQVKASGGAQCETNARVGGAEEAALGALRSLEVYPVPARGQLYVRTSGEVSPDELRLTDLSGRQIEIAVTRTANGASLSVGSLRPGLYLLYGKVDNQRFTSRIVIEK